MLILCPEFNKEISDKATACVHCGFPLKDIDIINSNICKINGIEYDMSSYLNDINNNIASAVIARKISDTCNIPIGDAINLYKKLSQDKIPPKEYNCSTKTIVKCPTCGSKNIKKLGAFYRIDFYAPRYFECRNCGI